MKIWQMSKFWRGKVDDYKGNGRILNEVPD